MDERKRREEERKKIEPLITRIRRIRGEISDFGFLDFELKTSRKDAKEVPSIHGHFLCALAALREYSF